MGRMLLQQFFDLQGSGDIGETVTLPEGKVLRRFKDLHTREYLSIFGQFTLERSVYGSREGQKTELVPLDTRLSLPEGKFSYLLQDWDQMICTEQPFKQVSTVVERMLGLHQHVDSLERMNRKMADQAELFCWSREAPPADEEGKILVETADGKGVPIRRPADAPRIHDHQHKSGPKPDRKKMATVGAVYTVDRHLRTPEEVVNSLFRTPDEERSPSKRPRPCHKRTYAQLTLETEDDEVIDGELALIGWIGEEVQARDPDGSKEKVCVMDGQRSLWDTKALVQDNVVTTDILDLLHVTPRLWKAANLFCRCGSRKAEQFVRERVLWILQGKVQSVIRSLRNMTTRRKLGRKKRDQIERICHYFENNKDRMRYDEYLKRGYPIASGVIEGACRHVVKDRLERTGMSWCKPGAQSMLLLRAIYTNDGWDEFIAYRTEQETKRLHPYSSIIEQVEWTIAA